MCQYGKDIVPIKLFDSLMTLTVTFTECFVCYVVSRSS